MFLAINISGVEATFRFTVGITVVAMGILIVFYVAALVSGEFSPDLWFNIADGGGEAPAGDGSFLPFGISGIFKALPFAIWFYLAIEEVPLAAEESMDPRRDVPKGTIRGMHTLLLLSIGVLLLNSGVGGGALAIGESGTPLFDGFKAIFGDNTGAVLLGMMGLVGLIASFFTIMYAYGRNTYSLSRAGYFPQFLSKTHKTRKTPHVALIAGAVVGYAVLWVVWYLGRQEGDLGAQVVAAVLNMAVFAAVLAYVLQCDLVRAAPPQEPAEHRSAVREPVGRQAGAYARRHDRARRAGVDLPQRGLPARRVRRRRVLRARDPLLRDRGPAPPGAVPRRGVRVDPGRAGRARGSGVQLLGVRAGGDPARG